ncbi:MAG TPA: hypothetical protein VGW58_18785, partial [Pyrinomonadaceae bacterium]|nr:hypothetical protein [Pyrinomonadaceae bacterium]
PVLLMSGGRSWLIVQSTAATGTGLGAWLDTVYQVSNGRVKPVATYLARVNQSGFYPLPSKVFVGSPVSCEIKDRQVILTVSYRVEYGDYSSDKVPLFTRQQTAVLRGSLKNGSAVLDVGTSEVAPGEFESIYNFDSMGPDQFVKYNYAELRAIANSDNAERKKWLKEFLATCRNTRMKRELSALLK